MHLSERTRDFWRSVVGEYELDPAHVEVLRRCCEAMDRTDEAREILDQDGLTVVDRYGQVKPHPATVVEVQNRQAVLRLLQALKLGEEIDSSRQSAIALARKRWQAS